MQSEKYQFAIVAEGNEVTIREGKALELKEPEKVKIVGVISTPLTWIKSRKGIYKGKECNITVDRDKMEIVFTENEKDYYGAEIIGQLQFSKQFKEFSINSGKQFNNFKLAELIKMNRTCFVDISTAMKLSKDLMDFKAKVDRDIELKKDDRANYALKKVQAVTSNLPASFKLKIPIFKGMPVEEITVEINIDCDTLDCSLVSPEAKDIVDTSMNTIFDAQVKEISEADDEIVIVEI